MCPVTQVVIIGGGPGGYEAALVAAQLGADVTVVAQDGLGGSTVLTDCVPSKTLIATADAMSAAARSASLGVRLPDASAGSLSVDLAAVNARIKRLAAAHSADIAQSLAAAGVSVIQGSGQLVSANRVRVDSAGQSQELSAEVVLLATGARPRVAADAMPDGERILTWEQLYDLPELPARLIVVGSGVTGAEFASAYRGLGSDVVLVSSRERVLPGEDADAAAVIEDVFARNGVTVMSRSRAVSARRVVRCRRHTGRRQCRQR